MADKDIVKLIRGTGNAARILGGVNLVADGILYMTALARDAQLPAEFRYKAIFYIVASVVLLVVGQRVYTKPDHTQRDRLIVILIFCIAIVILGAMDKFPSMMFVLLAFFTAKTLSRLKKNGPITNLPEVLASLARPTMTETERKEQKKVINRNTWKTVGLAVGIVFALFVVLIVIVAVFPEKFESDVEPSPIHITDPSAA